MASQPEVTASSLTISKLLLSTGNIMTTGSSHLGQRPIFEKSNTELINSLRAAFTNAASTSSSASSSSSLGIDQTASTNGHSSTQSQAASTPPPWTSLTAKTLSIPSSAFSSSPISEERSSYDITLKLFFLPSANADPVSRTAHAQEALNLVLTALNAPNVDLLIVSFPGISFDADDHSDDDENEEETQANGSAVNGSSLKASPAMPQLTRTLTAEDRLVDSVSATWAGVESLHTSGLVSNLGVAEFGSERLERFLPLTTIRPSVDQINVRDCCVVPKPLILYAKEQGIQLLTHNDCTDILPRGAVREILEDVFKSTTDPSIASEDWLKGEIVPQWVVKYTAVVRDRGVIENKGYFAMAEVHS